MVEVICWVRRLQMLMEENRTLSIDDSMSKRGNCRIDQLQQSDRHGFRSYHFFLLFNFIVLHLHSAYRLLGLPGTRDSVITLGNG